MQGGEKQYPQRARRWGRSEFVTLRREPACGLTRLAQVFVNLLNNAAKYTRVGGVIRVTERQEHNSAQGHHDAVDTLRAIALQDRKGGLD